MSHNGYVSALWAKERPMRIQFSHMQRIVIEPIPRQDKVSLHIITACIYPPGNRANSRNQERRFDLGKSSQRALT